MKLYLECHMGAAGDMLMGALFELLPDKELFLRRMRGLGLPGVEFGWEPMTKCGVTGTKMRIRVNGVEEDASGSAIPRSQTHEHGGHEHHAHSHKHPSHKHPSLEHHSHESGHMGAPGPDHGHYGYEDIRTLIAGLDLAENIRAQALDVYALLAGAESAVHGVPLDGIRFHEVGSLDAVADIVGFCLLVHMLAPSAIEASPVHVGSGFVRCAHGILPVPAPATAQILRGVPIYGGRIKGELCTPTGAALLRYFVDRFGDMEPMAVTQIGYGMGSKDFEAANCVRAFLGGDGDGTGQSIAEIFCNLDDMTPEAIGFATSLLLDAGALDVFTTPIYMKKNRPAVLLTCLCRPADRKELSRLIFRHTATLGLRYRHVRRDVLERDARTVETPYGPVRVKLAHGCGVTREKPEYDDVRDAALLHGAAFSDVYDAALSAARDSGDSGDT